MMIYLLYLLYYLFAFCLIYKNGFLLSVILVSLNKLDFKNFLYRFLLILFLFLLGEVVLIYNSCLLDFEMVQSMFGTKSLMKVRNYSDTLYYIKNTELGLKTDYSNGHIEGTSSWLGKIVPLNPDKKDISYEMASNFSKLANSTGFCKVNFDEFNTFKKIKHYMDLNFSVNENDKLYVDIRKFTISGPHELKCKTTTTMEFSNKLLNVVTEDIEEKQYITTTPVRLYLDTSISFLDNIKKVSLIDFRFINLLDSYEILKFDEFIKDYSNYIFNIIKLNPNAIALDIVNNELSWSVETPKGIRSEYKCCKGSSYSKDYIEKIFKNVKK